MHMWLFSSSAFYLSEKVLAASKNLGPKVKIKHVRLKVLIFQYIFTIYTTLYEKLMCKKFGLVGG